MYTVNKIEGTIQSLEEPQALWVNMHILTQTFLLHITCIGHLSVDKVFQNRDNEADGKSRAITVITSNNHSPSKQKSVI